MRYREYLSELWESSNRKTIQYLALFFFLVSIYAIYLAIHLRLIHAGTESDSLFGPLAIKLCILSALPFAVLAYSDRDWCSNDAAPVCVAAWIAVCFGFSFHCAVCALGMTTVFFPFILSALLAHGFGSLCRFAKDRVNQE
jgi:presenilin-like A22 family membrane protease